MVTTGDPTYAYAVRPKIVFKSIDESTTHFTFNAFAGSNPIIVTYMDVEGAVGESGAFNIRIADPDNLIDQAGIRSTKVFIQLGKTEATLHYFMIGFGDIFNISRPVTNYQEYQITGFGSAIQASQLYIHRRQTFKTSDGDARIWKIVQNALTSRLWRPLKKADESIEDITGWDPSGISQKVNIPFTVVNASLVYFNDFLDQLCSVAGAVWFIDFTGGNEKFTLTYNTDLFTNVNIKSGDLKTATDDALNTSYIKRAFNVEDNATTEAGIATRVISTQIIDKAKIFEQTVKTGSTNTTSKAIAQQIVIDNDARRIDSIEFVLSKVGDPDSPKSRINGDIVLDVSNKPTGTVLDTFSIPLSQIKDNPETIEVSDIDVSEKKLSAGQTKIWLRLFQRSNEEDENGDPDGNGDPNPGTNHTIRWHHNNIFATSQSLYSATTTTNGGDTDRKSTFVWNSTNQGPLYACGINSNIRRLFARTNKQAAQTLRIREVFLPTDFIQDTNTVSKYLSLNLSQMSKPRRALQDFTVTVPNNFIFKPYQWVSFNDGLSDIAQDLQVKRARYIIGSSVGDVQIGTLHAEVSLAGSYNTLLSNCSCQ